jgi:protocatechuate 3,4-dioxygenase beta subunit
VTGRALDNGRPVAGVSIYVFHADADGLYSRDGRNSDENARLFGALRTDAEGRYRYETIRPSGYGDLSSHVHPSHKSTWIQAPAVWICGSVTIRFFGAIAARVGTSLRRNSFARSLAILTVSGT